MLECLRYGLTNYLRKHIKLALLLFWIYILFSIQAICYVSGLGTEATTAYLCILHRDSFSLKPAFKSVVSSFESFSPAHTHRTLFKCIFCTYTFAAALPRIISRIFFYTPMLFILSTRLRQLTSILYYLCGAKYNKLVLRVLRENISSCA